MLQKIILHSDVVSNQFALTSQPRENMMFHYAMHALIRPRGAKTTARNKSCTAAEIKYTGVINSYDFLIVFQNSRLQS